MATELVLPAPTALGMVPAHDRSLVQQLRSSLNVNVRTSWSSTGQNLFNLTVERGLSAKSCHAALAALEADNARRADPRAIAKALATVTAVCVRPADFDDAKVILWSDRLREVLNEYPGEVALAVLADWPKTEGGKFWPTEHELREQLEHAMAVRRSLRYSLLMALGDAEADEARKGFVEPEDGMSREPSGAVKAFCDGWLEREPERAKAYLNVCRFGEDRIATANTLAQMVLEKQTREHAPQIRVVGAAAIGLDGAVEWAQ